MKCINFILIFFVINSSFSQSDIFEKGRLIDSIAVKGATNESFSMYLPKSYVTNTLSAIVFIFDPSGNGPKGIKPFISSAEEFNYILVCSNNSKNGPYQRNFDITNRLFKHVFSDFKIDEKQIYLAGFSGGSRLASRIALLTGAIQGVIGCGAGLSSDFYSKLKLENKFSYVGLVGDEDMNYQEMFKTRIWLDKLDVENELFIYEDGHDWPPSEQIERAFSWIEMQAKKRNIKHVDSFALKNFYLKDVIIADSLELKEPVKAGYEYDRIVNNYEAYFNLDELKIKREQLLKSKSYKQQLRALKNIERKELDLSKKFQEKFRLESNKRMTKNEFSWWKKELKKLQNIINTNQDALTVKMIKRVQFKLFANIYEGLLNFKQKNELLETIYCEELLTIFYPDKPYWYYQLAESYAKLYDIDKTHLNLVKAIENGLVDISRIKTNPLFLKFENDSKFLEFLNTLDN